MPKPRGKHSEIAGFIIKKLNVAIDNQGCNCFIPKECVVKPFRYESGYEPDVIVLDRPAVSKEPRWEAESTITMGESVRLIVEVVSTNWRFDLSWEHYSYHIDDYFLKATDYEEMGIPEYWIVDYRALGGRRFIGNPKQPTISVYTLVDGEYEFSQFREDNLIESPVFSELNLTAEQIYSAGN